ncbi:putative ankyrin repeat-containing domain, PGG domain, ankyrin repeat-containing domain superfamily [Helianthus annuus]|nr:putative ankyrin repeat-containing domain, PGG domain, ankyrin repeat-containing domain superfamily [Helianthus annuus]
MDVNALRSRRLCFKLFLSVVGAYENESEALQLLKRIWKHIIKHYSKLKIAYILSNPIDSINISDVLRLQDLVSEHLCKLELQSRNLLPPSVIKRDKAQQLRNIMSKHLVNIDSEIKIRRQRDESRDMHERISEHIASIHDEFKNIIKQDQLKEDQESDLNDLICKHITNMRTISHLEEKPYTCRVLFSAAEMGNTKFLVELICQYPDLILKVNDDNQTIFHIAVQRRHEGIYNLLYEMGSVMDLVTPFRDVDQNNMLHLAGKMCMQERLADVSGPALQMQRELLWFKEVRNMVPPYFMELRNKDGLTPHELFTKEHSKLITEGQKWMKETASQCMVVAALIATIVFAAAFTIAGGYDQTYGIPIFYRKPIFVAFVVADAMSLFLSSTSILTFLSILTSRYAERDFVESLPTKLMVGISTLFLSITAMMITFGVSFFILYHKKMKWIPILISGCAVVPAFLYVVLQYHVLADIIRSTYGSKYLFKPRKRVLY